MPRLGDCHSESQWWQAHIRVRSSNTCGVEFPVVVAEKEPWIRLSANFPKTKRNQDFLLEGQEMSDVQDLTPQLALALTRKQDLPTNHQWSAPFPRDGHFFVAAKFKQSSETSHWDQALNIKMASWSEYEDIRSLLQDSLTHHPFTSHSSVFHAALRTKPSLLSHVPIHHIPMFQPHAQLTFHQRAPAPTSSPVLAHTLSAAWESGTIVRKGSHGSLSLDYEPERCCGKSFIPSSHCIFTLPDKALYLLADELTNLPGRSDQEVLPHKVSYI